MSESIGINLEIATIKDGTHQTPKYQATGVPFYSVEHVTSGDFENTKFISEQEHKFLTRSFQIEKGDILMTRIGSIGDCKLIDWDVKASFYVSLALLKIKGASEKYISQYSNSSAFKKEIELHSLQHATPKKINLGPISDVKVTLPQAEAEQLSIAEALSDTDALIDSLEQLITKKRQIKQGAMQELLTGQRRLPGFSGGWVQRKLGEICSMKSGYSITSDEIDEFSEYPCYGGNGLRGYTSTKTHCGKYALIGRQGALCGNLVLVDGDFFASEHAIVVTPSAYLDIAWFSYILERMNLNQYSESSAQPGLSVSKLLLLESILPPKDEQIEIANFLLAIEEEIQSLINRLDKIRKIKQSMMQELLTGRIRLI